MNSTRRPWSRKYSAIAVATKAAFRRTRLGASLVAQTTTERARPAGPSDSSRKSTTSRPRSPTERDDVHVRLGLARDLSHQRRLADARAGEEADALALADGEQRVEHAHAQRQGPADARARQRVGGGAIDRPLARVGAVDRPGAVDRMAEPVEHAAEQAIRARRSRTGGRSASPANRGRCRPHRRAASARSRRRGSRPPRRPAAVPRTWMSATVPTLNR